MCGLNSCKRAWRWHNQLDFFSLLSVLFITVFHFTGKTRWFTRLSRKLLENKLFCLHLKVFPYVVVCGRYNDYADFHALEEVLFERAYDVTSLKVLPKLIVDAGGHIGMFSLLAGKSYPKAHLWVFEPDPENFSLLSSNITINNVRANLMNCALGLSVGTTHISGPSSMGRRVSNAGPPVKLCRLSEQIDLLNCDRLMLKIDVEGAEWDVLEDCRGRLPWSSIVFIETHGGLQDISKLEAWALEGAFTCEHTRTKGEYTESVLRRGEFAL